MIERRRIPRWEINKRAWFKLEQAAEEEPCRVGDINYNGLGIFLTARLPENKRFHLGLRLSENCVLDVEACVAWRKPIDGVNHYGLYFLEIKDVDKNRIYCYIKRYCRALKEKLRQTQQAADAEVRDLKSGLTALNRRVFERFTVYLPARLLNPETGEEIAADAVDLSAKGMRLSSARELKPATPLEIWLDIPDREEPLYTRGKIVWSRPEGLGGFVAGVELEKAGLMDACHFMRKENNADNVN